MIAATDYAALRAARRTLTETADALFAAVGEARPMASSDITRVAALNLAASHLDDEESEASLFPECGAS